MVRISWRPTRRRRSGLAVGFLLIDGPIGDLLKPAVNPGTTPDALTWWTGAEVLSAFKRDRLSTSRRKAPLWYQCEAYYGI